METSHANTTHRVACPLTKLSSVYLCSFDLYLSHRPMQLTASLPRTQDMALCLGLDDLACTPSRPLPPPSLASPSRDSVASRRGIFFSAVSSFRLPRAVKCDRDKGSRRALGGQMICMLATQNPRSLLLCRSPPRRVARQPLTKP